MAKLRTKINKGLINILSPTCVKINRNNFEYGENIARIYGITKYPQTTPTGFLSKVTNIPKTFVNIHYRPVANNVITAAINRNTKQNMEQQATSKEMNELKEASISIENMNDLLEMLLRDNERMGQVSVNIMGLSKEKETFEQVENSINDNVASISSINRALPNLQKQCLESISPTYQMDERINEIYGKVMPLSTFVGGFPFASTGFNDGQGYYLAKDVNNSLIITDFWLRSNDRTNSNMVVTGKPGSGKSTAVKHILLNEYARGTKLFILDPEREYIDMAKTLGGDVINVVGGKNKINPLQILKAPVDEDEEVVNGEKDNLNDLARHIGTLEVFFKLYNNDITNLELAELKKCIIKTYNKKDIDWNTDIDELNNEDYPILSDLYETIEIESKKEPDSKELKNLLSYLYDLVKGADQFLWNGHTNININSNIVVFDTKDLQSASDNKKSAEYYNVITYIWNMVEYDRSEKTLICADESYLMVDVRVPQTLIFLRNISKRIRKYEGSLILITHDVEDFLNPSIKQYGQSLLSTACYKILFGTDGQNLLEEIKLFNLTDAERELLEAQIRGHALFIAGTKKIHANFVIDETEFYYMGSAGGR
ncbi:MAG: DUF87 domain-containing protein [Lachnospiraceae bacterium]|nr:DUF87 domain-containing protein [Lachnospiraceae bacterium]